MSDHEKREQELVDLQAEIGRCLDEAMTALPQGNDPAPALAALERARAAWTRVHDQLSLDV